MKILADCHLHSNTSYEAENSIDEMCAAAIEKGLQYICFNNHFEHWPGRGREQVFKFDPVSYGDDIERAREHYGDRIEILKGVEFGQPHLNPGDFEMISAMDFDMITGSIHMIPMDFLLHWIWWDRDGTREESRDYIYERYFEETERMIEFGGFDLLAHPDWIKLFFGDDRTHAADIRRLMQKTAAAGIVTEINTAALRRDCDTWYPGEDFLQAYKDGGGKHLTIGSDAHPCADIAADFDRVAAYLPDSGFRYGYFRQRKFIELP